MCDKEQGLGDVLLLRSDNPACTCTSSAQAFNSALLNCRIAMSAKPKKGCFKKLIPETGLAAAGDACCVCVLFVGLAVGMILCMGVHDHFILKLAGLDMHRVEDLLEDF